MRTLMVLFVIAAGLLGFILFVDRGTVSDDDLARREGRVLQRFFRDRITEISVTSRGKTTRLLRKPEDGELALGTWYVEQPYVAEADQAAVDILLGELEWMDARRRLTGVSDEDLAQFGLEKPSFAVSFKLGREEGELIVGKQSPKGDGYYVQADASSTAFVVGRDLIEVLDHTPEHYHSKVLHDGVMAVTTQTLEVHMQGQKYLIERRDGELYMTAPQAGRVNDQALRQFADALDQLQAKRFIQSTVEDEPAAQFGIGAPFLDVKIEKRSLREDAAQRSGDERYDIVPMRFRVGAPCAEHEGERYLLVGDTGPVMCVAEAELEPAREAVLHLRETRLAAVSKRRTSLITIEDDGGKLTLRKDGKGFVVGYAPASGEATSETAHEGSVEQWIDELVAVEATVADAVPVAVAHPDGERKVRFERDGKEVLVLTLRREQDHVLVLRQGEPTWSEFPVAAWELTAVDPANFRNHRLLDYPIESLRSLTLSAPGQPAPIQALRWDGAAAEARLSIPGDLPADPSIVRELSRRLATLSAARFVTLPAVRKGDWLELEMEFAAADGTEKHRLRIATIALQHDDPLTEEHAALLDDRASAFTLPPGLLKQLRSPWVARDLPAQPLETLAALRIEGNPGCTVLREGQGFELTSAHALTDTTAAAERAQRIAEAWATLHASALRFAAPPKGTLSVVQESIDGRKRELRFGQGVGDDAVFVEGLNIAFELPEGQRKALIDCSIAPTP